MKFLLYVFPLVTFFIGIFLGYFSWKIEEKGKYKRLWVRMERRNIMRTINALVAAIDFKDHQTKRHSDNVKYYAALIAQHMDLPMDQIKIIKEACQLHDLGKIGVHDYILTKPGKLTAEEWSEIKSHSLAGAMILKPFHFLKKIVEIVRQHHERYDGTGYPDGLAGDEICMGARIMTVADSYDAMVSKRPYKDVISPQKAVAEIKKNRGIQFDPVIVDAFLFLYNNHSELFNDKWEPSSEEKV